MVSYFCFSCRYDFLISLVFYFDGPLQPVLLNFVETILQML